jgi:hypothetical protein
MAGLVPATHVVRRNEASYTAGEPCSTGRGDVGLVFEAALRG